MPDTSTDRPLPVVLDVDTGVDDALALLLAAGHSSLDLRAVTCVAGNAELASVVANTLRVLDAAAAPLDLPVSAGAARPLLEPPRPAPHVHGLDGMGDLGLPVSTRRPDRRHAIALLRDVLLPAADDGRLITVIALAPLTNIALLLRSYPEVTAGIGRLVFMGGGLRGNATAAAEFNVWQDPEAAAVVLDAAAQAGLPVTMYGLDVFYAPQIARSDVAALRASGTPAARVAADLIEFGCDRDGVDSATIGDAGTVAAVVDPGAVGTSRFPVRIELAGAWTRGQTVVDRRDRAGDLEHDPHRPAAGPVDVTLSADGPRLASLFLRTVGSDGADPSR